MLKRKEASYDVLSISRMEENQKIFHVDDWYLLLSFL
ncbi:hypothetical protein RSSL_02306 (plasmid) [Streptococcus salivarius K12]|uniref:Uncharacterized protein n=1 Tax=Streptococcus salivarius K12 TaxID=1200793 RepID=J7T487_STRSL|nr:hypothetical protein RSSL_02306 [Streptococcus salivarius K12]